MTSRAGIAGDLQATDLKLEDDPAVEAASISFDAANRAGRTKLYALIRSVGLWKGFFWVVTVISTAVVTALVARMFPARAPAPAQAR
jgi:hypothetical protein